MLQARKKPSCLGFSGFFWALRDWVGFENLCLWFYDKENLVRQMMRFVKVVDRLVKALGGKGLFQYVLMAKEVPSRDLHE